MINENGWQLGVAAARRLAELDCCEIGPGLTDAEFDRVEAEYGFEFAADHRAFLATGLPIRSPWEEGQTWEKPWPDWRDGNPADLRAHLNWPVDFLLDDVRQGSWLPAWGPRPDPSDAAVETARSYLADVPRMIPVYGHRFLPAGRGTFGHPVLSMWGDDIVYYGTDLLDYVNHEFEQPQPEQPHDWAPQATVPFWSQYLQPPTTMLWRPTGPEELELVRQSDWTAWPPRLPEQPIFYPVLDEDYAIKIAREWNVPQHGVGYVTQFRVDSAFLQRYPVQQVGGSTILELWVPAEELDEFNAHLVGPIEVVHEFR